MREAAEQLLALANQARAEHGAPPLEWDGNLAAAARQHCLRMAAEGPIAHRYGGEPDLSERAGQDGAHFSLIEENVAVGPSPAEIHDGWMHSPGHRSNLLNPEVDRVGIAVVAARGTLYAVADYAHGVQALTRSQVEARVEQNMRSSGIAIATDNAMARAACAMDEGLPRTDADGTPRFIMRWQDSDLTRLPQALRQKLETGQYRRAEIGSCPAQGVQGTFTAYRVAVLLF
ncbi:MAG: CAP domain-containing protein [Terracidiphilus sp.]